MKKKLVEQSAPPKPEKQGFWVTVQILENILVLNFFKNKILRMRHCLNTETGEYQTLENGIWKTTKLEYCLGLKASYSNEYYYDTEKIKKRFRMSEESRKAILHAMSLKEAPGFRLQHYTAITSKETDFAREKRERTERNRLDRVNAIMGKIPAIPDGIRDWIDRQENGGEDYALKDTETGKWSCSHCGGKFEKSDLKRMDGQDIRNSDMVLCPSCGKEIRYLARKRRISINTHFMLAQPVDREISVVRHFDVNIYCDGGKKNVFTIETIRMVLFKRDVHDVAKLQEVCDLYYEQYGYFDNKTNKQQQKFYPGFLYDGGIEEAFKHTILEDLTRLFCQMAAAGAKLHYHKLINVKNNVEIIRLAEMLFKGRFRRLLLEETCNSIFTWSGKYYGDMNLTGRTIEEVFGIADRQKINRIRDRNGGKLMVEWMRWSDRHKEKIPDTVLSWLQQNNIKTEAMRWILVRMTPLQAMNYLERQKKESYKTQKLHSVINQYNDYMNMCKKLHRDTRDEMVYKPRELKRRHDEAVAEIERRQAELKAEEYSKKFGEAEQVLGEIKEKFEYAGKDYLITVPGRIVDIVAEGNYLHHCAGATDRYFDRIKQHETYICFLRKQTEPDTPFYTIEVEPGGTIRQHRGMYDEEPDIDKVKPFLKEWQREIRKRMRKEDHEKAAVSKQKREANIEELKAKKNTRVLQGLMEDFMEAIG